MDSGIQPSHTVWPQAHFRPAPSKSSCSIMTVARIIAAIVLSAITAAAVAFSWFFLSCGAILQGSLSVAIAAVCLTSTVLAALKAFPRREQPCARDLLSSRDSLQIS